jgi:hypothetical protein
MPNLFIIFNQNILQILVIMFAFINGFVAQAKDEKRKNNIYKTGIIIFYILCIIYFISSFLLR